MKSFVKMLLVCGMVGQAWVCVAAEGFTGKQCAVFERCTPEQETAALDELCPASGERSVTTTTVTSTTSTTVSEYKDAPTAYRICRWTSKSGKRVKHCLVSGYLTATCGGGHTRRDGTVTYRYCVVRN